MKKTFTFLFLVLSLFLFLSCSFFSINKTTSIVIYFDSANHSKAVTYNADDVSYFVVSIEPKVQDDIKVDIAAGEISAEFSDLKVGTYKIKVSAFREDERKIAYGNSGSVYVNAGETTDVPITMKFLADYSTCVVGDIILNDGTACTADEYVTGSNSAVAVIVRAATDEKPALGVGIVQDQGGLAWCNNKTVGVNKNISTLVGTTINGFTDGQNGWELLKAACSDAEDPSNYPAWEYSLSYASKNDLGEDFATGWYLPTLAELKVIYDNRTTVNQNLSKIGVATFVNNKYYWSCNEYSTTANAAYILDFNGGSASIVTKPNTNYVCSVRVFN